MSQTKQQYLAELQTQICLAGKQPSSIKVTDEESLQAAIEANEKILKIGEKVEVSFGKACPIDPEEREGCLDCQS